jgi:hypothetical protein
MQFMPPGVPNREWRNIASKWLGLKPPDGIEALRIAPNARLQIARSDLDRAPALARWVGWLEQRRLLVRVG